MDPAERRAQLLDAALEVAEQDGFDAVTVAAVVKRAGVTRPVLYDLFGDLDGLLHALIEREEARALAVLAEVVVDDPGTRDPDAYLVAAIARLLDAVRAEPRTWRFVLLPPQGSPPALRERIVSSRAAVTARVEALLVWGIERRGGPHGLDLPVFAHLLVAAGEDAARLTLSHPRRFPPRRLTDAASAFLSLVPPGRGAPADGGGHDGAVGAALREGAAPAVAAAAAAAAATADDAAPSGGAARGSDAAPGSGAAPGDGPVPADTRSARMPQAQRREQLLDVTLALVARDGFDALSVEAVAREAEVNRVVVYRSFASLQVLVGALLLREQRRIEGALDAILPRDPTKTAPRRLLVDALDGLLAAVEADPLSWRLALAPPESAPVAVRALVMRRRRAVERRMRRLVAWGVGGLAIPADRLDVDVLAQMLLSVAEQSGRLLLDERYPAERLRAAVERLVAVAPWVPEEEAAKRGS
jgi:AcrR family transcriptional regulator